MANRIQLCENGPLGATGDLTIAGQEMNEAWLCRCGKSANKPFCDGAHKTCGFAAGDTLASDAASPSEADDGPLTLTPAPNGPLLIKGNVALTAGDGTVLAKVNKGALCRCGATATSPFCDGAHKTCGFEG